LVCVVGSVENGATMECAVEAQRFNGRNDVFVVQLNGQDGTINWLHQIGAAGNEGLTLQSTIVCACQSWICRLSPNHRLSKLAMRIIGETERVSINHVLMQD
jgi:hypothetical protein